MKKIMLVLFGVLSIAIFAKDFDREESLLEAKLFTLFPIIERNKEIDIEEIDVDIYSDNSIEVSIEFDNFAKINSNEYDNFAKKIKKEIQQIINSTLGKNYKLKKLELEKSGVENDEKIYRF